jgi:hypothetical protein
MPFRGFLLNCFYKIAELSVIRALDLVVSNPYNPK